MKKSLTNFPKKSTEHIFDSTQNLKYLTDNCIHYRQASISVESKMWTTIISLLGKDLIISDRNNSSNSISLTIVTEYS